MCDNLKIRCCICKNHKDTSSFYKNRSTKNGYGSECKICVLARHSKRIKTKDGLLSRMYKSNVECSKTRGHELPEYTRKELRERFINSKEFNILYDEWVKKGYDKNYTPSIDRIDDYKSYSFDNIKITTWRNNREKYYKDAMEGTNLKRCKSVKQFSIDNVLIKEHYSLSSAAREVGSTCGNIAKCCKGERRTTKGFIWTYPKQTTSLNRFDEKVCFATYIYKGMKDGNS